MDSLWKLSLVVFLSLFTVHLIWGQEVNLDEFKSQLPPGVVPDSLNNVTVPVEKALDVIKDKCSKESGSDAAYEEVTQASTKLQECLSGLMNFTALQEEIEHAKPTGDLETVFNKYCKRRYTAIDCVGNFTDAMGACLSERENKDKKIIVDIVSNLLNFVCHKEGDQIALFIAEKGPECFTEKKDELMACMNATFGEYLPSDMSADSLPKEVPKFTIEKKQCDSMDQLKDCVVDVLATCEETTPANLVESAFKFIRNETPCKNMTSPNEKPGKRSNAMALKAISLLGSSSMALLLTLL